MSVLDEVRENEWLGRDFLVWLWFKSETAEGMFELKDGEDLDLWFDGRITLRSEGDRSVETIVCTGEDARIREARFALREEKKVTRAKMHLRAGDDEWAFDLDSTWLNFHALKTPRIVSDKREDPEALFYEKIFLVEKPISILDDLFSSYLDARMSPTWETETFPALLKWIREGITPGDDE